jgi:hypothetical protein
LDPVNFLVSGLGSTHFTNPPISASKDSKCPRVRVPLNVLESEGNENSFELCTGDGEYMELCTMPVGLWASRLFLAANDPVGEGQL